MPIAMMSDPAVRSSVAERIAYLGRDGRSAAGTPRAWRDRRRPGVAPGPTSPDGRSGRIDGGEVDLAATPRHYPR